MRLAVFSVSLCLCAVATAQTYDVIILGAGAAGISAAKTLHDAGITNFVILEAAPQIGGRLKTGQFAGRTVELGARWVHGLNNNPIWALAQKYGLQTVPYDYDDWIVRDSKGNDVTDQADTDYETLEAALEKSTEKLRYKVKEAEPDVNYRSAMYSGGWYPNTPVKDVCEWYEIDFDFGIPAEQIPLKNGERTTNDDTFTGGDRLVIDQRGYRYVLVKLAEEFLTTNDNRLKLNSVVTKVEYKYHPENAKVIVTTESGQTYEAKYAIITFSLGVFHHNLVQYSPPLPTWKTDVLNNMDLAYDLFVYVKFPQGTQPFWDNKLNILHAHERRGYYPLFVNNRKLNQQDNFISIDILQGEAVAVSRQDKSVTMEEINRVLRNLYGSRAVNVEDILIPDWIENKFFHGMYSSVTTGLTNKTFHAVPAPIGPLFFAGEHTTYQFYGYVQGAYLTGIRAAREILDCHQNRYCPSSFFVPHSRPGFYYKRRR